MLLDIHECPQGSLISLELQALSFTPQDHSLAGSCSRCVGKVLPLGAFREPPTLRQSCDGAVDREFLRIHAPGNEFEAACRAESSAELG